VLVQSNGLGEFGEGRREPMARVDIHTEGTNVPDLLDVDQAAGLQPIACRGRWLVGSDAPCRLGWLAVP
jgi:hypothetical protein